MRNKFAFLWLSWFFWFLLLALVYVPFGQQVRAVDRAVREPLVYVPFGQQVNALLQQTSLPVL